MKNTPSHDLSNQSTIRVESLDYQNSYDFTSAHRHNYFELICFEKGGGKQLIDFKEYEIKSFSAYLIHPNQIHLLSRAPDSKGFLFQFYPDQIISSEIACFNTFYDLEQPAFFEHDPSLFILLSSYRQVFELGRTHLKAEHFLLNALLLDIMRPASINSTTASGKSIYRFKELLERKYKEFHQVTQYAQEMGIAPKTLHGLTNKYIDQSPLKMIHDRIYLEARRLLLFETSSIKEIGFELGFSDASAFSNFIKSKSGLSPLALQREIRKIHK